MKSNRFGLIGLCLLLLIAALCSPAMAVTAGVRLSIPPVDGQPGATIALPLMINQIDNLAGVKLVIQYDPAILAFVKAAKTDKTASLMHVVNDRQPGRLIVVMAGAIGIKGEDFAILTLSFTISAIAQAEQHTEVQLTEVQLMSDTLKDIACATQNGQVGIILNP